MLRSIHSGLSLRWRLSLWYAVVFGLTLLILLTVVQQVTRAVLVSDLDARLRKSAQDTAALLLKDSGYSNPEVVNSVLQANSIGGLADSPLITIIRSPDHTILSTSAGGLDLGDFRISEEGRDRVAAGEDVYETIRLEDGRRVRLYSYPVIDQGKVVAIVQTSESLQHVESALDRFQRIFILGSLIAAAVAGPVGYLLAHRGLNPLERVVRTARQIEASDLKRRLAMQGAPAEVQRLADTFDSMLARLEEAFEQQKRFVADVSHELRTPLTALRGNIDVLLLDPGLPPELREQLSRMSAECGRLIRLSSNLLYLAQADLGRPLDVRPVDLDVLCLEVLHQARDLNRKVRIRMQHEDQVTVMGDADRLKQLVLNLVENAVKYTPPGGTVSLGLYREEGWARIVVRDTGPGIPEEDLPHIFERFYRANGRRRAGGAGLGLAIAQWAARTHGGEITVQSTLHKGSTFTVRLPIHPPDVPAPPRRAAGPPAGDAPTDAARPRPAPAGPPARS
ncbi:MAG TPA: HAMP domain-containing sensor histidine kinase [Dehalococcoidia bacterium]